MTRCQTDVALFERTCLANPEAMSFLKLWSEYCHAIDDIVDSDETSAEFIIGSYAIAVAVYTHPFFLKNIEALRQIVLNVTNSYADSVAFERSSQAWRKEWADHYRHCGLEMVNAVASICAGPHAYRHLRSISGEWRTKCYLEHLEKKNDAVFTQAQPGEPAPAPSRNGSQQVDRARRRAEARRRKQSVEPPATDSPSV